MHGKIPRSYHAKLNGINWRQLEKMRLSQFHKSLITNDNIF